MGFRSVFALKKINKFGQLSADQLHGWFHIIVDHNLNSSKFHKLKSNFPYIFNNSHRSYSNKFISYVNEQQLEQLQKYSFLSISKADLSLFNKISNHKDSYIINAYDQWNFDKRCTKIRFETFLCNDLSVLEANALKDDAEVLNIIPYNKIKFNSRFSAGYIQSGTDKLDYEGLLLRVPRTLQINKIDGEGQVISVIDTGVDFEHTFFKDRKIEIPIDTINKSHRKIINYINHKDDISANLEHGTGFCGYLAGTTYTRSAANKVYEGVATGAKLQIIAINEGAEAFYNNEEPFGQTEEMKKVDAHISGNAWMMNSANELTAKYDELAYNNQDNLYIFATGNDPEDRNIYSPADSKNVLTIGSTTRPASHIIEDQEKRRYVLTDGNVVVDAEAPFPDNIPYRTGGLPLDLHDLQVTQIDWGACAYVTDVCVTEVRNANLVILNGNLDCKPDAYVPILRVSEKDFQKVKKMKTVSVNYEFDPIDVSVTDGSGIGTGSSSFVKKPDLVAPGEVVTAKAGCDSNDRTFTSLAKYSGSSFASAGVTGLAAMVRQYFMNGFYPSSIKEGKNITPSASLIKAVLINGAQQLKGYDSVYNLESGYGTPNLGRSLGFEEGIGARFLDNVDVPSESHLQYTIIVPKSRKDFSVTLTYTDPPTNPKLFEILYADLDLVVEDPYRNAYSGNQLKGDKPEELSTTERVFIKNAPAGTYRIHVYSNKYKSDKEIKMALAVYGGFDMDDLELNPEEIPARERLTCPMRCNTGKCIKGKCKCPEDRTGAYCQSNLTIFKAPALYQEVTQDAVEWNVVKFPLGSKLNFILSGVHEENKGEATKFHLLYSTKEPRLSDVEEQAILNADSSLYTTSDLQTEGITSLYWGFYPLDGKKFTSFSLVEVKPPAVPIEPEPVIEEEEDPEDTETDPYLEEEITETSEETSTEESTEESSESSEETTTEESSEESSSEESSEESSSEESSEELSSEESSEESSSEESSEESSSEESSEETSTEESSEESSSEEFSEETSTEESSEETTTEESSEKISTEESSEESSSEESSEEKSTEESTEDDKNEEQDKYQDRSIDNSDTDSSAETNIEKQSSTDEADENANNAEESKIEDKKQMRSDLIIWIACACLLLVITLTVLIVLLVLVIKKNRNEINKEYNSSEEEENTEKFVKKSDIEKYKRKEESSSSDDQVLPFVTNW